MASPDSPWKQSRYSSRCPAPFTCTTDTGKLLEEEANTAGAKEWSFLSRNSGKAGEKRGFRNELELAAGRCRVRAGEREPGEGPTLQRVLLHVDFVEFIGSDEDTVIGEVDAAAGLRGLYLLRQSRRKGHEGRCRAATLPPPSRFRLGRLSSQALWAAPFTTSGSFTTQTGKLRSNCSPKRVRNTISMQTQHSKRELQKHNILSWLEGVVFVSFFL